MRTKKEIKKRIAEISKEAEASRGDNQDYTNWLLGRVAILEWVLEDPEKPKSILYQAVPRDEIS
jgi:hypothetical protein